MTDRPLPANQRPDLARDNFSSSGIGPVAGADDEPVCLLILYQHPLESFLSGPEQNIAVADQFPGRLVERSDPILAVVGPALVDQPPGLGAGVAQAGLVEQLKKRPWFPPRPP